MRDVLQTVRDEALRKGVQFMDARGVSNEWSNLLRQDGKADKLGAGKSRGMCVRVLHNGAWGFSSTDGCDLTAARECLDNAIALAKLAAAQKRHSFTLPPIAPVTDTVTVEVAIDPRRVTVEEKMRLLEQYEQAGLACGKDKFVNTIVSYNDSVVTETVCNTAGTLVESTTTRVMAHASFTAKEGDVRQNGYESKGARAGFEFIRSISPQDFSVPAATKALHLLKAQKAPSGKMPVIFHPSITGLLVHEALGHNAEADHVLAGTSILEGKIGQKIGSDLINIVDDSTLDPTSWGSYAYDSEGTPGARRVIIEKGVLVGLMHTLESASRMGVAPTGSGRAQGHHSRPIVRMSNTLIVPGAQSLEELINDIDYGLLLTGGHWGYVQCEKGQFTCHAGGGRIIRNGQLCEDIRDVSVSGMTLETLLNIDAISSDFEMKLPGMCGKQGQSMQVNAGGPYVRIKELVVGGQGSR